jgi:quercetin dioxygenase-like cupin family protein
MPAVTREPQGDYPHPSALHHIDLAHHADALLASLPGHTRQSKNIAREGGVSLLMMAMEAGDMLREHSAPGVVAVQVLRGRTAIACEGKTVDVGEGELILFQTGVRHDLRAKEQSVVLLTVTGGDL